MMGRWMGYDAFYNISINSHCIHVHIFPMLGAWLYDGNVVQVATVYCSLCMHKQL